MTKPSMRCRLAPLLLLGLACCAECCSPSPEGNGASAPPANSTAESYRTWAATWSTAAAQALRQFSDASDAAGDGSMSIAEAGIIFASSRANEGAAWSETRPASVPAEYAAPDAELVAAHSELQIAFDEAILYTKTREAAHFVKSSMYMTKATSRIKAAIPQVH